MHVLKHDDGSAHHDNCPCGHFDDDLHYGRVDEQFLDVDYFHDGRTRHVDQHNCTDNHCEPDYVLVRRTDLDDLRDAVNDIPDHWHSDLDCAARTLVDNARPAGNAPGDR